MAKEFGYYRKEISSIDGLTPKERTFVKTYLANNFDQTAAAKAANYKDPTQAGYSVIRKKHIQQYLAKHVRNMEQKVQIDFEWKMKKLAKLINDTIPDEGVIDNAQLARLGLDGIAELNKMQGDIAPTKTVNANINVEVEQESQAFLDEAMKQFDREY